MAHQHESIIREPLMTGKDMTFAKITNDILLPVENKPNKAWWIGFTVSSLGSLLWVVSISYTFWFGLGAWGLNKTVGWAWDITGFVWWVGIGHAGTLISAVLLIFRQNWRNSINRSAEAMTIFAVICAATYIVAHMGRPWLAYFTLPLPNQYGSLWVNWNSALMMDVFAISTYFSVSLLFWYTGLLPDIASIRDRATGLRKRIYSILSFGWTGSLKTWQRFETVSLILAGISTPLVLSVHTIVSFDFATSLEPGWHTTIFPPYFVAGAIFSGFAMVQTLLLVTRKVLGLENYITMFHIESMNKIILLTGSIVGVAYITEFFIAWYSGVEYEQYAFINRATGPYWWAYWSMMSCNVISPQLFWSKYLRTNIKFSWFLSIIVNIGMWFERFVIIVTSLHRDYIPSSWAMFYPTWVDVSVFIGSIGLFFTMFLLFVRVLPSVAIAEVKLMLKTSSEQAKKKLIEEGHLEPAEVQYYKESLTKFDSVDSADYEKV
ncbi:MULTISPECIES: NrfD/PsrC family molybdoenzyme membrane anchor subunit [unclassified Mucilaginibacter]|uniref:NrfD/PsrC family molybdoenzyme membrane anchor subunit n=1 Tax=unclassified Mucilaginibacter TaxID=2617802 RepID=UPI002AC9E15B|nr:MULTISPECIES: NrfD/PsrC family molybdoenzyme membrane anchor subunit [unclassified Mucilaginibacter]MEB0248492.1 polysulfide reductase NrfD [Mucilaginibacter sp. 5B2]MEB0263515.1 polysulfide reductase NrfD [Mucilaginibacter sp. 10I4]MEB0280137.1 polysulfide reductase NrfD [Mucilaginibacter sp. 10B2]MEB0301659.1 polysulfide reductase NrfD [Mucilaginibacter sp. 5C4]WPX24454.1 NrfD/PsrC family molybdoenzyme membrane anchor subunit [Mucilaginibacter sp. 5C4]